MADRLFGLETEYAFAVIGRDGQPLPAESILMHLMELARARLPCLRDAHSQGIFLGNAARFYIDCGLHVEMTTPECANPWDLVRYVLAGEQILSRLAAELEASDPAIGEILILKSNVDYSSLATWGCHESYLHRSDPRRLPPQIIPHLASRIIYTGAGGFNSRVPQLQFTVSPRVWHLETEISGESTHHRGIFHTKDESLSTSGYHRLHILCGESLCSHTAMWLKAATTAAVVALIEGGVSPGSDVAIPSPLQAMQVFAADPECRAKVQTARGRSVSALDIQRRYLEQTEAHMHDSFMPPWTPDLCRSWREILDCIQQGTQAVATRLDWAIKLELYAQHAQRHGVKPAGSPGRTLIAASENGARPAAALRHELCEIDLRFGRLGEGKGIFDALDRAGVLNHRVPGVDNIEQAMENPPATGRAKIRGQCVRRLAGERGRYLCSWHDICDPATGRRLDLQDPFASDEVWLDRPRPVAGPPGSSGEGLSDDDLAALLTRHAETVAARRSWIRDRMASRRARTQTSDSPEGFSVGDRVILGRHEMINGSDNWLPLMEQYVGRIAVITGIAGLDRAGCRTVRVDIDSGRWMWRTRSLRPAPGQTPSRT